MGQSVKDIACRLNDVEYSIVSRAAFDCKTTVENFLVTSGVRLAHSIGASSPYEFAGRLYVTHGLPDAWYEATSEDEMICHLKVALRARDLDAASAMAVELLDFPASWAELEDKERILGEHPGILRDIDPELAGLVTSALGEAGLARNAPAWDCYKAILRTTVHAALPGRLQRRASL